MLNKFSLPGCFSSSYHIETLQNGLPLLPSALWHLQPSSVFPHLPTKSNPPTGLSEKTRPSDPGQPIGHLTAGPHFWASWTTQISQETCRGTEREIPAFVFTKLGYEKKQLCSPVSIISFQKEHFNEMEIIVKEGDRLTSPPSKDSPLCQFINKTLPLSPYCYHSDRSKWCVPHP